MKIKIKALSVNKAFQGRRFKTKEYKNFETELLYRLEPYEIPDGRLELFLEVGISSKLADIDNIQKPFIDILQKKYNFNDKRIYGIIAHKVDVLKSEEYIDWNLLPYTHKYGKTKDGFWYRRGYGIYDLVK